MNLLKNKRLYLSKDENVYVNFSLSQNQVDLIRFLYNQFKKKTPFVILNDSSGPAVILQVALFLSCMKRYLDKPALILSDEVAVLNWVETFNKCTDYGAEVESSTPCMSKKKYHISPPSNPMVFLKNWSMVVIHNMDVSKELLNLKANYKIWVTAEDLKENLSQLFAIHSQIYPRDKLNMDDLIPNKNSPRDVVEKAIMVDALFEDMIWRSRDFVGVAKIVECKTELKILKKNKDITGIKIKRTKRKIEDTIMDISDVLFSSNSSSLKDDTRVKKKKSNVIQSDSDPDVDSEIEVERDSEMDATAITTKFLGFLSDSSSDAYDRDTQVLLDNVKSVSVAEEVHLDNFDETLQRSSESPSLIDNIENKETSQNDSEDLMGRISPTILTDVGVKSKINTVEEDSSDLVLKYDHDTEGSEQNQGIENCTKIMSIEIMPSPDATGATINVEQKVNSEKVDSKITANNKNTAVTSELDDIEQEILIKYKGSLLDRIF